MQKTYITTMPDKAGAFLRASEIIAGEGGNIVRVNYNKAVDLHTLFIDVAADSQEQLRRITEGLRDCLLYTSTGLRSGRSGSGNPPGWLL